MSVFSVCILLGISAAFPFMMASSGAAGIIFYLLILSIGFSLFYPANNKFCIMAVPENRKSMSVGIFLSVWVCGMSLGVSFFEMVFSTSLAKLPQGLSSLSDVMESIPTNVIYTAFHNAYISGFFLILVALVFLIISFVKTGSHNKLS
jgi:hypothetical protein